MRNRGEDWARLLNGLQAAADEHGAPNSFSPGWLHLYNNAPIPSHIGQLMSGRFRLETKDYTVTYSDRLFQVYPKELGI